MHLATYHHPFDAKPNGLVEYPTGKTLLWYLVASNLDPQTHIVIRNGGIVPSEQLEFIVPREGDDILIRPVVMGGSGGKQALSILVMAAVVVGAYFTGGALLAAGHGLLAALAVGGITAAGAAIQTFAIGAPRSSKLADTPTYSWSGPQTTAQQGIPIPRPVGRYINNGNVIASYIESINDQQFLNALICMGIGPAKRLDTIKINGNDIGTYYNATFDVRLGKNFQSVCSDYSRLVNNIDVTQKILAGPGSYPIVINGVQNDTQAAEFEFYFPKGLWAGPNDDQSYDPWAVSIQVEYQKVGDPGWTSYIVPGVTNPVDAVPYWLGVVHDYRYDDGREIVVQTENNPSLHYQGETFSLDVLTDPVNQNNVATIPQTITVTGVWKLNPYHLDNTGAGTGTIPSTVVSWTTMTCSFESNQGQTPKRFVFTAYLPSAGQYNWRFTKLGSSQHAGQQPGLYSDDGKLFETYTRRGEETWVSAVREITYQSFTYPNHILLALRVCATNQLSGSNLQVSAMVEMDNAETQGYVHAVKWDQPDAYFRFAEPDGTTGPLDFIGNQTGTYRTSGITFGNPSLIYNSPDLCIHTSAQSTPAVTCQGFSDAGSGYAFEFLLQLDILAGTILSSSSNALRLDVLSDGTLDFSVNGGNHLHSVTKLVTGVPYHICLIEDVTDTTYIMINGVIDNQATVGWGTQSGCTLSFLTNLAGSFDELSLFCTYFPQMGRLRKHALDSVSEHNALEAYDANLQPMVVIDAITNTLYGGSMSSGLIDVEFYDSWSQRCLQNVPDGTGGVIQRHAYNGLIDQQQTLWDTITNLSHTAGAAMMRTGFYFTGILDAPGNPRRLINVAQVIKDTFEESWSDVDDRANSIDIIYYDELNFFKRSILNVQTADTINAGKKIIKAAQVDLRGETSIARAWHYGNFVLKSTRSLTRTVKFSQPLDSISTWPGEVVFIQHDLPEWGVGGKLLSGCSKRHLYLDQDIDFDTSTVYNIMIQLKLAPILEAATILSIRQNVVYFSGPLSDTDNSQRFVSGTKDYAITQAQSNAVRLESTEGLNIGDTFAIYAQNYICIREVGSYDPTYRMVTLNGLLPIAPDEFDSWTFGSIISGQPTPFHVMSITRRKDLSAELSLMEYQDSVYTDDQPQISPAPVVNDANATITGILGNELFSPTGTEPVFAVSWRWGTATAGSLVYVSRNGGPELLLQDMKQATSVNVDTFTGEVLLVRVVGYDADGKAAPYSTSPTVGKTIAGTTDNPATVIGFVITTWDINAQSMTLEWTPNTETNLQDYLVSWMPSFAANVSQTDADNNIIATVTAGTNTLVLTGATYKGIGTYIIRARTTKGFVSLAPSLIRAYSLDNIQEGNGNKTRKPSTGQMSTVPDQPFLAVAIAGGLANVVFSPFVMRTGVESINVLLSTYTVTGLTQGQGYYFYYDDPNFAGGAVTIHATQDVNVLTDPAALGSRFIINSTVAVMPFGSGSTGGSGSGGGAGGNLVILKPLGYQSDITPISPTYAYDNNSTTFAQTIYIMYSSSSGPYPSL